MPNKGQKPGKGTYMCTECGAEQTLRKDTDVLEQCGCEGMEFKKKGERKQTVGSAKK
ncbi:MAG: hypothetical protein M0Z61_04135 [Nitrospiraceae bacterium]|nr:hypothetical protein [Nitrospiraceae bacterium]